MNNRSPRFSIFIPTWNNLSYLKLCIESIRKNSVFEHQILVYVNDGHDGSKKKLGQNQFLNKYDITSSTFRKYMTLRDKEFSADNVGKIDFKGLKLGVWKSKLKKIFSIFKSGLAKPLWKL